MGHPSDLESTQHRVAKDLGLRSLARSPSKPLQATYLLHPGKVILVCALPVDDRGAGSPRVWPDPLNRLQHPLVLGLHVWLKWNLLTRRAIAVIHLPRGHLKALKISSCLQF